MMLSNSGSKAAGSGASDSKGDRWAAGYACSGGEVHDGAGPNSWIQRTDSLLEALFPIER